jgi:hypothetical protein
MKLGILLNKLTRDAKVRVHNPGTSTNLKQIEPPHPTKENNQENPFWLRGYVYERFLYGAMSIFLIVLGVILAPITIATEDKGPVVFLYTFLLLMQTIPLSSLYKSFSWLYIFKEGIWIHRPLRRHQFLEWDDITQVRSSPWGNTLTVADATGDTKARVYGGHRNSNNFMYCFMQERPDLWKPEEGLTFSTSSLFTLILLVGVLFELGMAFTLGSSYDWGFWLMLGFAVITIVTVWMIPMSIRLQEHNLVLRYPFRDRLVSAHDIASMTAVYAPMGYIEMRLKDEKTITLLMFSLGINLLYAFLWSWHAHYTRPNLARGWWGPGGVRTPHQLRTLPMLDSTKDVEE